MNNEQVKEELMKRYMYLYQNKELILSLCIHCSIEKKKIVKKIKGFKNILKNCKDDEMVSNTIKKIINDYKVELNTEKYYLMSNVNDNVVSMFEDFLFSDFDMEELDLYKHIEAVKSDEKYLGAFNYLIEQLEDRRNCNANLSNIPTFTVWKILSYVRRKNSNNKILLDALDKYYNIDRFVISNSDCISGYRFLECDYDKLSEDILNKYPNVFINNWNKFGEIVVLPNKNCFEEEDEYFDDISEKNITYDNNAKSCFMLDLANMPNLDIESKEYIRNNLIIDKKKLVKN